MLEQTLGGITTTFLLLLINQFHTQRQVDYTVLGETIKDDRWVKMLEDVGYVLVDKILA